VPNESLPDEFSFAFSDPTPAKAKKHACIGLARLLGKVFGQHNPVVISPERKFLNKQSGSRDDFRFLRIGFEFDLPKLLSAVLFNKDVWIMASGLRVKNVHDLAWLLMKARHIRIAIQESEGVEFIFGLPLKHPPHLP
jgi:hypothetical protein